MARTTGLLIGALAAVLLAWSPESASADSSRHGDRRDHRERHFDHGDHDYDDDYDDYDDDEDDRHRGAYHRRDRHRHGDRYGRPIHRHKSVHDDGHCRYTYKSGPRGTKETVRCRDRRGAHHARGYARGYDRGPARGNDLAIVLTQTVVALLTDNGYAGSSRSIAQRNVAEVLDRAPDGQRIVWDDAASGARYQVVPTETYRQRDGRYCREYLTTATVGGQTRELYGRACRQPDGAWEIAR